MQVKINMVGLDTTVIVEGRDLISLKLLEASVVTQVCCISDFHKVCCLLRVCCQQGMTAPAPKARPAGLSWSGAASEAKAQGILGRSA